MGNVIVTIIIFSIFSLAIFKIIKEKRKGNKCIGCAISGNCDSDKAPQKSEFSARQIDIKEV